MIRKTVQVGIHSVSYLDNDVSGKTILLIHGNSAGKEIFRYQFPFLTSEGYRIIVPDLPGHNQTSSNPEADKNPEVYTLDYYADFLQAFLDNLGIDYPIIIGHSLGGHIAVHLAGRIDVSALVLIGTPLLENYEDLARGFISTDVQKLFFTENPPLSSLEKLQGVLFPRQDGQPEFIGYFLETDPLVRGNLSRSMVPGIDYGEVSIIRQLSCPVLSLLGDEDPFVPREYTDSIINGLQPRVQNVIVPRSGHFPHFENPSGFNELVIKGLLENPV